MKELWYYAHRFRDEDPIKQASNLELAKARFSFFSRGSIMWAPWFAMAEACLTEDIAWIVIDKCVRASSGIVLDLDGADEPSPGMIRERDTTNERDM